MTENKRRKYKANVVYLMLIDNIYFYVGCHTPKSRDRLSENDIVVMSGNPLKAKVDDRLLSYAEYKDRVKLLWVEEFDTEEEALEREVVAIEEIKDRLGERCLNKVKGNKDLSRIDPNDATCDNIGNKKGYRQSNYEEWVKVIDLYKSGMPVKEILGKVSVSRPTVFTWVRPLRKKL